MVVNVTSQVLHNLIITNGRTKRLVFYSVITGRTVFIILMYVFACTWKCHIWSKFREQHVIKLRTGVECSS